MTSLPSINDFNEMFDHIFESRIGENHLYLTITAGNLGLTTDQSRAINLKNLNVKVGQIVKIFVENSDLSSKEKNQYEILAKNLRKYAIQEYKNKNHDFPEPTSRAIQFFIEATHRQPKLEAPSSAKNEDTEYGSKIVNKRIYKFDDEGKTTTIRPSILTHHLSYAEKKKHFEDEEDEDEDFLKRIHEMSDSFKIIKNDKDVGIQDIERALSQQIRLSLVRGRHIKENLGFISSIIFSVLNSLTEKIESGELKQVTTRYFTAFLESELIQCNIKSELIDRETFEIIFQIGKEQVKPLTGKYLNMKQLMEEYKYGKWKKDETRMLSYQEVNEATLEAYCKAIQKFEDNKTLQKILDNYFGGLSR